VRIASQALTGSTTPEMLDGALSGKVLGAQIYQNNGNRVEVYSLN
jgi:hypothetical protein